MTYLDRAIKDGYAIITGPENKQKIIYVTSDNHTENYNEPEEKVRAEFWAELIYEYDYPAHRIKVEVTIPDRVPTDRADIVIFSDDEYYTPHSSNLGEGEKESLLCSQTNIYEQQRLHIFTHYYGRGKKAVDRRFSSVLPTF